MSALQFAMHSCRLQVWSTTIQSTVSATTKWGNRVESYPFSNADFFHIHLREVRLAQSMGVGRFDRKNILGFESPHVQQYELIKTEKSYMSELKSSNVRFFQHHTSLRHTDIRRNHMTFCLKKEENGPVFIGQSFVVPLSFADD